MTSHLYLQNPPKGGRAAAQHHVMWPAASRAWLHLLQPISSTATIPCTMYRQHHRPTSSVPRVLTQHRCKEITKDEAVYTNASRHRPLWPREAGLEVCRQLERSVGPSDSVAHGGALCCYASDLGGALVRGSLHLQRSARHAAAHWLAATRAQL